MKDLYFLQKKSRYMERCGGELRDFFFLIFAYLGWEARAIDNKDKPSQVLKQSIFVQCMIQNDFAVQKNFF